MFVYEDPKEYCSGKMSVYDNQRAISDNQSIFSEIAMILYILRQILGERHWTCVKMLKREVKGKNCVAGNANLIATFVDNFINNGKVSNETIDALS